jgi:hypothetical protein
MIKNTNYILLFLLFLLLMLYFYCYKKLELKNIIVYSLIFTVFLKVFSEYNILNKNKIECFESNNNPNKKNDNKNSKKNDTITENSNLEKGQMKYKNKGKREKSKNNNLQKESNIQFVKKNKKTQSELSTQKLNKVTPSKKKNKLIDLQNEIDNVIKEILINRYKFYNKEISIKPSEFEKRKKILEGKLVILQQLNNEEQQLNNIEEKKKKIDKYKPETKQTTLIDTQGETIDNANYSSKNTVDLTKVINTYSKKTDISKHFTFLDSLFKDKENTSKDKGKNTENKIIEGFTSSTQKCNDVQFYNNNDKYCFITKGKKNCYHQEFDFGINKKLDSSFISILNYINRQKKPLQCVDNNTIIEYLKKWNLFEYDKNGYYLERYRKMFSIFISSDLISEKNKKIFVMQIKVIDKMINIRFNELNNNEEDTGTDDDNEEDIGTDDGNEEDTVTDNDNEEEKPTYKNNEINRYYPNNINQTKKAGYQSPVQLSKKLDNSVFNRVISAPYYENRFEKNEECKKCKKCPDLPNMDQYIKKTEIPCWGCKI